MDELFQFGGFAAALAMFRLLVSLLLPDNADATASTQPADVQQKGALERANLANDARKALKAYGFLAVVALVVFGVSLFFVWPIIANIGPSKPFSPVRVLIVLVSTGWLLVVMKFGRRTYDSWMVRQIVTNLRYTKSR